MQTSNTTATPGAYNPLLNPTANTTPVSDPASYSSTPGASTTGYSTTTTTSTAYPAGAAMTPGTADYSTSSAAYNANASSLAAPASTSSYAVNDPSPYNSPVLGPSDPTYVPPNMPARSIANAEQTPDIHTSLKGPEIHSTTSFTTNTGAASQPVDLSNEALAKPSTGLMHMFKKMTLGGQNRDLEQDPMIMRADQELNANVDGARALHAEIVRYQQAQQALQNATVAVANAFHHVLADETNPYAGVSAELVRQSQMHSIVPVHSQQLLDLTNSAIEDTDGAYASIRQQLNNRKTKASDVEYYRAKVAKLTADHEAAMVKKDIKPADKERLERNIGKMREIELEYNQENERVIADMNALWRRRIIRLGPALSSFLLNSELVHAEQLAMFQQLGVQVRGINVDQAHHTYLTSSATMLVPTGAGYVDNRELINQAHSTGIRADVVSAQRHLEAERQQRTSSVSNAGGSLETVAQETIIRSEEQMRVMKERFVTERVRLRKVVTTEMVQITVPVRKESVQVEHIAVHGPGIPVSTSESIEEDNRRTQRRKAKDTRRNVEGGMVEEDEEVIEMILSEERPRVINDVVPIERVRLRKLRQVRSQQLEMDLMREHIDYSAPVQVEGAAGAVTVMTGGIQTVSGQQAEGFTDRTGGQVQVVNRPITSAATATTTGYTTETAGMATQREYAKADVDDVEAMRRVGYGNQQGAYGQVNTVGMVGGISDVGATTTGAGMTSFDNKEPVVGVNHPYYNGGKTAPGAANTFDQMTASPDISATNPSVDATTNRPVV